MGIPKPEHSKFEIRLPNKKKLLSTVLNTESERRLIYKTWELLNRPANSLEDHGALFYPSAGYDLVTPTIIGLPFCTRFYFFESGSLPFGKIKNFQRCFSLISDDAKCSVSEHSKGCDYQFTHADIERHVYWIKGHNKKFLEMDINLAMYFHRGDSPGEGGSGECWDSEFLAYIANMAGSGTLRIVTQGEPGGIHILARKYLKEFSINNRDTMSRDGLYFIGELPRLAIALPDCNIKQTIQAE